MNFQQIEYALAVHRQKHFGLAAEQCKVTQATLSAMLKRLENELNYLLFDRSSHPIRTTEEGQAFMRIAEEILTKKEEVYSLSDQESATLKGKLLIGIIPTVANSLLPIVLKDFMEANPLLEVHLLEITTEEIIHKLNNNSIDLGILSTPLPDNHDSLEEEILYYEAMMVYGISNNQKNYVSSSDVKGGQIWLLEEGHCFRSQSMTICEVQEKKLEEQKLKIKGNSFETLINLSDQFGGFTLIPELYYKSLSKARKERCKHFQKPIPVREISLVSSRPILKRQAMKRLAKLIQSKVPPHLVSSQFANKDLDIIAI